MSIVAKEISEVIITIGDYRTKVGEDTYKAQRSAGTLPDDVAVAQSIWEKFVTETPKERIKEILSEIHPGISAA